MNKIKLIKAINQKGLKNSLISIYYNIGRALPFRAQRFPDGRISDWYRSQFVEVHEVKPSGKGGKYGGQSFRFIFQNDPNYLDWLASKNEDYMEIHNSLMKEAKSPSK